MAQVVLENVGKEETVALMGSRDENLRALREALDVKVIVRNGSISLEGDDDRVELGRRVLARMRARYRSNEPISSEEVRSLLHFASDVGEFGQPEDAPRSVDVKGPFRTLHSRSPGQARYLKSIRAHDLTLCIGPAGTGKTYLAVAAALESLHSRQTKRLVLVRPAVEAGEKLGYLPGDLEAKVNPFLRPLLDALRDMLDFQQVRAYLENDIVEIAPLAFMRGRTLNESFIILDEAQNTTTAQMKMFLTRMGSNSKVVVTGDVTQVDLPDHVPNGLSDAIDRLGHLPRIGVIRLGRSDIVRHPLVEAIVDAYEGNRSDKGTGSSAVDS